MSSSLRKGTKALVARKKRADKAPGKPPAAGKGSKPRRQDEVDRTLIEVERLMAASVPPQDIADQLGMPRRTLDQYRRAVRVAWAEAHATETRPELIAETVERLERVVAVETGSARIQAERLLAEVRGLVGSGLSVRIGLAQTTVIQAPTYDYTRLSPDQQVVLRELLLLATVDPGALPPGDPDDGPE